MIKKYFINYAAALLLGILVFASDFLNTDLFNFGEKNFAVWFVLSLLCFACGWYINKTLGWHRGGKIVFSVIVSVTAVSIVMITFFGGYFGANELLTENLILYSVRNVMQEVIDNRKNTEQIREKVELLERESNVSKKEAELIIKEANIKAEKIINDAEAKAKNVILDKERIEKEIKEFIQTERELIKRYEDK